MTESRKGRRLGRGLDVLLPPSDPAGVREVALSQIEPNPSQPRQRFERKALEDLAESVRMHGILHPLVVSRAGDERFRLIVGERRWQAAKMAGMDRVPVVVKEASDRQTLELALIENVQRSDLNALEEAAAYQRLIQDFGLTQQEVASQVGKSRVTIANTLRLLALPETIKQAVIEGRVTEGHGRALLAVPEKQLQLSLLDRVVRDDLTVRQTEELIRRLVEPRPRPTRQQDPNLRAAEEALGRSLGAKVSLRPGKRGGRIVIEYYSDEEFDTLFERLGR